MHVFHLPFSRMFAQSFKSIVRIRPPFSSTDTCIRHYSTSKDASNVSDIIDGVPAEPVAEPTVFEPRQQFRLPTRFDKIHWYPRHMSVQLKRMEGKLRTVDLIIEVHDARVALTGRNPIFEEKLYAVRPHILVLNKMDLIDMRKYKDEIEDFHRSRGVQNILWTNCKKRTAKALSDLQKMMLECLRREHRFNRTVKTEYQAMIVGIPNVGKSSLVNSLRQNNLGFTPTAVAEGARPGVTVRVQNKVRLLDKPLIYVLDTPGLLNPHFSNIEGGMKLALCNLILESATKPHFVADFLLYFMNKNGDFSYVKVLDLPGPTNDLRYVLLRICETRELRMQTYIGSVREERWNFDSAVEIFIGAFRRREFADAFLDRDLLR